MERAVCRPVKKLRQKNAGQKNKSGDWQVSIFLSGIFLFGLWLILPIVGLPDYGC